MISVKKVAKKIAFAAAAIAGLYLLLLLIAGIYINTKKGSILAYIRTELEDKLRGKATLTDLDISVWRHFPAITFQLNGFALSDSVYNKPILSAKTLATTFNIFYLTTSKKEVKNISIENGVFHLFTDSNGYSNNYLLQPKKKDTTAKKKKDGSEIAIEHISIEALAVTIEDAPANKEISFVVNNFDAAINQVGQVIDVAMEEKISMKKGLGFSLAQGAYLENQTLEGSWKLTINMATQAITFDKTNVKINDHPFELSGGFFLAPSNPAFKIMVNTSGLAFEHANAIVTAAIREKIGLVQMKGPLTVDALIEGSLLPDHEPLVNVNWKTENNTLITPVASFTECSFEGNFMNSVNKDSLHSDPNSRITFKTFSGNWDGIKLNGKNITITDLLTPQLDFDLYSNCTFQALDDKFALKDVSFVNGTADLHLSYTGPITKDNSMLQNLEGQLKVKNGTILYVPRNFNFTNCNGDIAFYKDSISMRKFSCSYLKNKLEVQVEGKNIRRKFVVGDLSQEAIVKCYVRSPYLNLEDFKSLFAAPRQRTSYKKPAESFKAVASKLDNILLNSIIGVQVKVTGVKYQHMESKEFNADIKFHPHHWEVAKISMNLAGGSIITTGQMVKTATGNHTAVVGVKINNVDVKKLLYAFDNFGQDAITHEHLAGIFSTNTSLKAGISSTGKIIPASLFGKVDFSLKKGSLQNFPPLASLKTFVFKNRDMTNVRFAEIKDKLEIKGTEIYVNRMEIQSSVMRLFLEGNYGLAGKNTELLIQVPLSNLSNKSFAEDEVPKNKGTKAKGGSSIWLRAQSDDEGKVKMKLTLRKKFKNKKVEAKAAAKRA